MLVICAKTLKVLWWLMIYLPMFIIYISKLEDGELHLEHMLVS